MNCKIKGCEKPLLARGWCNLHYLRWRAHGSPTGGGAYRAERVTDKYRGELCTVAGCGEKARKGGMCRAHYSKTRIYGSPFSGRKRNCAITWLKAHTDYDRDECLSWPFGGKQIEGRGRIKYDGKLIAPARAMCIEVYGPSPSKRHHAAHSCGNGHLGCVNPRHLRWATPSENERDKIKHGTYRCGERIPSRKLTASQVAEIRCKYADGIATQKELAASYGIVNQTVSDIVNFNTWRHV